MDFFDVRRKKLCPSRFNHATPIFYLLAFLTWPYCLGQVSKGPDSPGVVRAARELGGVTLRGNHDFEVSLSCQHPLYRDTSTRSSPRRWFQMHCDGSGQFAFSFFSFPILTKIYIYKHSLFSTLASIDRCFGADFWKVFRPFFLFLVKLVSFLRSYFADFGRFRFAFIPMLYRFLCFFFFIDAIVISRFSMGIAVVLFSRSYQWF